LHAQKSKMSASGVFMKSSFLLSAMMMGQYLPHAESFGTSLKTDETDAPPPICEPSGSYECPCAPPCTACKAWWDFRGSNPLDSRVTCSVGVSSASYQLYDDDPDTTDTVKMTQEKSDRCYAGGMLCI